jgi:hypothetical protein
VPTRHLIDGAGATYDPETVKMMGFAFDEAWAEIAGQFQQNGLVANAVRLKLADAILQAASAGTRDAVDLKEEALRAFGAAQRH